MEKETNDNSTYESIMRTHTREQTKLIRRQNKILSRMSWKISVLIFLFIFICIILPIVSAVIIYA